MYVALRDLRAARGRFALITAVVVLVALLVSFLSGLTAGLGHQNISAPSQIAAERVVFADGGSGPSYDESSLTGDQIAQWRSDAETVDPIGLTRGQAGVDGGAEATVALLGANGGFDRPLPEAGTVLLSEGAATDLGASAGDTARIGDATYTVAGVGGDDWFSHSPVVWMALEDWQHANPRGGDATVLAVSGVTDEDAANAAADTVATSVTGSFEGIASYQAENMSLSLMTTMLFAISALVIGAFFTVWTVQRTPDIATLKALGATTGSLVRDALGQAFVILVLGVALGIGLTTAFAVFAGGALPFVVDVSTTLVPGAALVGLGLVGAAFALRFLVTTDPLTALDR
ncbi:ABC transporter permease [Rhodococcus rhodnii]|uniref:ABC transporter permease n=1 Tax=Rhodococcus rhodnii TaxID=38312 RepID=A0A6P2CF61_9NOCA|nr:ABC transporter permease [Rhodococcus rhodnii]TXG89558.1 ABC transporter permease [Rhodococcus rhodnii]